MTVYLIIDQLITKILMTGLLTVDEFDECDPDRIPTGSLRS